MHPDAEIAVTTRSLTVFKSGRIKRTMVDDITPAGTDSGTGVTYKDVDIDVEKKINARIFIPKLERQEMKLPVLVYYHGGGFFEYSPSTKMYTNFLTSLVAKANVIAVSVGYRLAPENPLPVAYDDSFDALQWVVAHKDLSLAYDIVCDEWLKNYGDFDHLFLAGDNTGANIVHQMALRAVELSIKGVALIHPWFWSTQANQDLDKRDEKVSELMDKLWKLACPETTGCDDPLINPLAVGAPSLKGLVCENLIVMVAEQDMLRDRGNEYYDRVKESGWEGNLELFETRGAGHVFHLIDRTSENAMKLMDCLTVFLNRR